MSRLESCAWSPIIALQLLTRLPTPTVPSRLYEVGNPARRYSLVFFPVVGVLVGLVSAASFVAATHLRLPHLACAAIAIGVGALLTGGFHEDGLADVADALGKLGREDALEVMRDSRIGSFGAVALWVALTIKASALAAIPTAAIIGVMVVACALSRVTPLLLVVLLPPARKEAGRSSASVVDGNWVHAIVGSAIAVIIGFALVGEAQTARACLVTLIVVSLSALFFKWRFGGYTGDCLGATVIAAETAMLCLFCA